MIFVWQTPSLMRMASVKISTELWKNDTARLNGMWPFVTATAPNVDYPKLEGWHIVEISVKEKVPALKLPEAMEKYLLNFIKQIGIQIHQWWIFYKLEFVALRFPKQFFWTPHGAVDHEKTTEFIVKNEIRMSIEKRYILACIGCLEDEIRSLWKFIPEQMKKQLFEIETMNDDCMVLVCFWTFTINGAVVLLDSLIRRSDMPIYTPNRFFFRLAMINSLLPAAKYFFERLNREEKDAVLGDFVTEEVEATRTRGYLIREFKVSSDVVCFMLTRMNKEQQERAFQTHAAYFLECILVWSWQPLFLELIRRGHCWRFMSQHDYSEVMGLIAKKWYLSNKDPGYKQLFVEFWQQRSENNKFFVLGHERTMYYLHMAKEEELMKRVFNSITAAQKEQFFYSAGAQTLVHCQLWDCLEFLISEGDISEEAVIECKRHLSRPAMLDPKYEKYFQLLDDFVESKKAGILESSKSLE